MAAAAAAAVLRHLQLGIASRNGPHSIAGPDHCSCSHMHRHSCSSGTLLPLLVDTIPCPDSTPMPAPACTLCTLAVHLPSSALCFCSGSHGTQL